MLALGLPLNVDEAENEARLDSEGVTEVVLLADAQGLATPVGVKLGAEGDSAAEMLSVGYVDAEGAPVGTTVSVGVAVKGMVPTALDVTVIEVL